MSTALPVDRLAEGVVVEVRRFEDMSFDVPREPHRHDYHEIVWVESGEGEHLIDEQVMPIVPGTVVVIGRRRVHQFRHVRNLTGAVLRFRDDAVDGGAGQVGGRWLLTCIGTRTIRIPENECANIRGVIDALAAEAAGPPDAYTADTQRHLVSTLLLWLERWFDAELEGLRAEFDDGDAVLHRRFVELLESDYASHHDAAYYADALGVPQTTLSRALTSTTGMSTKELIVERVMLEASRLLRFTDLTVSEIAFRVGYRDPLYFSRAFKRHMGSSPQTYRASVRGKSMDLQGSAIGS